MLRRALMMEAVTGAGMGMGMGGGMGMGRPEVIVVEQPGMMQQPMMQ